MRRTPGVRGRRRALSTLAVAVFMLTGGCSGGDEPRATTNKPPAGPAPIVEQTMRVVEETVPEVEETALSADALCWEANDAIRRIISELMNAPNTDAALIEQTVASYRGYGARLRELAGLAESDADRRAILAAAAAAEEYAQAVHDQNSYHVDIAGVIDASRRAFPSCDLEG
jgi:hypothetical protein